MKKILYALYSKRLTASLFFGFISILIVGGCVSGDQTESNVAMVSVSSDGRYVLTSHYGRILILWDIEKHTKKIINQQMNIFSPYFIDNTHYFLWQEMITNEVHVQSLEGEIIKSFNPGFPVYGHVMTSNLKHYIASTDDWSLYHLQNGKINCIKKNVHDYSGSARLLKLSLKKNYLLTSGECFIRGDDYPISVGHTRRAINPNLPESIDHSLLDGVVLWEADKGMPIKKFIGNSVKTVATLSPDASFIASGDENSIFYLWETKNGKRIRLDDPISPRMSCSKNKVCIEALEEKKKNNPVMPKDFYSDYWDSGAKTVAVKFIDEQGNFIRFVESSKYGVLYNTNSPHAVAYIKLGEDPKPDTYSIFNSANVIDSAPKAKILVMGQARKSNGSGIIVYRFDEKTKQLDRVWAPDGPPPHQRIKNKDNRWEG